MSEHQEMTTESEFEKKAVSCDHQKLIGEMEKTASESTQCPHCGVTVTLKAPQKNEGPPSPCTGRRDNVI